MADAGGPGPLEAVLFDYGHTLCDVRWDESTLLAGERVLLAALPAPAVDPEAFHRTALAILDEETARATPELREVDYGAVVAAALARHGVTPAAEALRAALRAEIRSWDAVRFLHPDAAEVVDALRARGLRVGYVSNTLDPPDVVLEVMADEGMAQRADAIVLSSEVGYRKPAPAIYRAALERIGAPGPRTLFVGDRVLEDVIGPSREGMRTCLATWFRSDEGDHGLADAVAAEPRDVLALVDRIRPGG